VSTWIKLHDNLTGNPKILAAGEDAAWLYVCGLCYCSSNLTDGRIPTRALRMLTAKKDARTLAKALCREGLWVETAHGWEVHEYLLHQRSKAQILKEREGTRNRVAAFRERKRNGAGNASVTQPETEAETDNPTPTPPPPADVTWQTLGPTSLTAHVMDVPECEVIHLPRKTIDPVQLEHLRATRGDVFTPKSPRLPDTTRSERGAPASPLPPVASQEQGRGE
jgi:hypothetical protein